MKKIVLLATLIGMTSQAFGVKNVSHELATAIEYGQLATVVDILFADPDYANAIDPLGTPVLTMAVNLGMTPSIVEALLQSGADITATNATGETALMAAIRANKPAMVRVLLDGMARVGVMETINALNENQETALTLAQDPEIRQMLIDAGAGQAAESD